MKYLMLVCVDPTAQAPDEERAAEASPDGWVEEMDARGVRVMGDVTPVAGATTVRVRGGEVVLTDGPYVEAFELIAGFDVLDCADLDEAVAVATRHPMARGGVLELRPFLTP